MNIQVRTDDIGKCNELLSSGEDREVLRCLRENTTVLVLMVRLENENRQRLRKQQEDLNRPVSSGESFLYTEEEIKRMKEEKV